MLAGLAIWTVVVSAMTAILYFWDKRAAIQGRPRIREKTLLACSILGGWPGGLAAGQLLRHKTQKASYRIKFSICAGVNVVSLIAIVIATR
jgi:uncharacterized membrane protein YsdA (DUF1294 family)